MNKIQKTITLLLMLACMLLSTGTVHAAGLQEGRVIFGENFTLKSGDTLTGDLVVFGGNVTVEEEAVVKGDVVVIGGNVTQDGTVEGSLVLIGGSVSMGEAALVEGDLVTVGGWLDQAAGAEVEGDVVTNIPAPDIRIPSIPIPPSPPEIPNVPTPPSPPQVRPYPDLFSGTLGRVFQMVGTAILVAVLAMLGSLFLQPQIERVSQAIVRQPVIAGAFGLLTFVLTPFVLLILLLTFILIPVAVLAIPVLGLAWLFGMSAIGFEVGERFTRAINQTWPVPLVAGTGTLMLMLVVGSIGLFPCLGLLAQFLVALVGVGGVALTFFGSRPYPSVVVPVASTDEGAQE